MALKVTGLPSIVKRYSLAKQIPIFSKLGFINLQKIARKVVVKELKRGETLCHQGAPPEAAFFLISGRLCAFSTDYRGGKSNVEFIHRGMHFGIVALLTKGNQAQTCEVFNDAVILEIKRDDFQALLRSVPRLGIELSHSLSRNIQSRSERTPSITGSKIISVHSPIQKMGVSTYALNLALSISREAGKKAIYINMAPLASSESANLPNRKAGFSPWKRNGVDIQDMRDDCEKIQQGISRSELGIDLLSVTFNPQDEGAIDQVSHCLTASEKSYDYIVIDLPREIGPAVLKALSHADVVQLITLGRKEDLAVTRDVIYRLEKELGKYSDYKKIQVILSDRQEISPLSSEEVNEIVDFDIHARLPDMPSSELRVAVVSKALSIFLPPPESAYALVVRKIAREISRVSVGLVLGGGAALGMAHIGVLRVLEQEKIPIDIVAGSSMGALLAAFWTTGMDVEQLEQLARGFEKKHALLKLFDPIIPISGLIGGRLITRWLEKSGLEGKTFDNTRIPLKIVAYDLIKRQEIVICSGSLVSAVRKSIAIPGVFKPIMEREKMIIDGGVLNPLPTNVLASLDVKKIIAVNVLQSPEQVRRGYVAEQYRQKLEGEIPFFRSPWVYIRFRLMKLVDRIFIPNIADIIVRSLQASEYVIAEQNTRYADVVIHPDLAEINWFELYKVDDLIKRGEAAARTALPAIKKLVQE